MASIQTMLNLPIIPTAGFFSEYSPENIKSTSSTNSNYSYFNISFLDKDSSIIDPVELAGRIVLFTLDPDGNPIIQWKNTTISSIKNLLEYDEVTQVEKKDYLALAKIVNFFVEDLFGENKIQEEGLRIREGKFHFSVKNHSKIYGISLNLSRKSPLINCELRTSC